MPMVNRPVLALNTGWPSANALTELVLVTFAMPQLRSGMRGPEAPVRVRRTGSRAWDNCGARGKGGEIRSPDAPTGRCRPRQKCGSDTSSSYHRGARRLDVRGHY